jgi:hypothetical protein
MNTRELKKGDRVRVTRRYRADNHQPGDKGTIWSAPKTSDDGTFRYYPVAMDGQGPDATTTIFTEDEIEPDV